MANCAKKLIRCNCNLKRPAPEAASDITENIALFALCLAGATRNAGHAQFQCCVLRTLVWQADKGACSARIRG